MLHPKRKGLFLKVITLTTMLCILLIGWINGGIDLLSEKDEPFKYKFVKPLSKLSNISDVSSYLLKKMPDYKAQYIINTQRIKWAESVCDRRKKRLEVKTFGKVWSSSKYSLAFCIVPKNGCTHWKSILRFLEHDHVEKAEYPSDLNRYKVHYGKIRNLDTYRVDFKGDRRKTMYDLKFMFARDPYARLWSAYLDKFVLPDFWRMGIGIVQEMRLEPDVTSLKCGNDVSFQEFVRYNFIHRDDPEIILNEHFQSIVYNCDPCKFNFDIIGKIETFKNDTDFILVNAGVSDVIKNRPQEDPYANDIISLTDYNLDFKLKETRRRWYSQACFDDLDIAKRLWRIFQYNGYISDQFKFPERALSRIKRTSVLKEKMKRIILNRRKDATEENLNKWKMQRIKYMQEAYRNLSNNDVKLFQQMYSLDFEIFQYEKNPHWLHSI